MAYKLECGVRTVPLRMVVYGPEGIGKSTFAAQMPEPVFIDVEGGTNQLPVARLPKPSSWTMLLDEVRAVRMGEVPCKTLVIDTADAAEVLCARHLCKKNGWDSIESPGYGKGYTHLEEEFGRLLDALSDVVDAGRSVVMLCHSVMRKFERPDESGAYDRFELKLSKKVSPKVKEWCDILLFCDYKTYVSKTKSGAMKASGGARVIRTSHNPVWDAKNRFGLPDEMPLDMESAERIAALMAGGELLDGTLRGRSEAEIPAQEAKVAPKPTSAPIAPDSSAQGAEGVPKELADLMASTGVTADELRGAVASKGYFPRECKIADYPADFTAWLVTVWPQIVAQVEALRIEPPFATDGE